MLLNLQATATLLVAAASFVSVSAISKVSRQGKYLYTEDGNRFFMKGIAYQEQGAVVPGEGNDFLEPSSFFDPLSDAAACTRDVARLTDLSVNTIRVYSVNASLNHDSCMKTFSDAGIYAVIDLSLPINGSIDRLQPTWSSNLLDLYVSTIDAFEKYDNVLAYTIGNEVVTSQLSDVAPYVKAAARDTKAYLASKSSSILVAYSAIDGASGFRLPLANFLTCDIDGKNSGDTSIDLYGLNNYEWCGDDTVSAYNGINSDFANLEVAAYFSEYGCVREPPRLWTEVAALFGSDMAAIWSGGIAFSYFPAASADGEFGMVTISGDTVTTSQDYDRLKAQYSAVSFVNTPAKASAAASSYGTCPGTTAAFNATTKLPPTPNEPACNCLVSALSCRFTPTTSNYSVIMGELLGAGCSLLGSAGLNCDEISSDTSGTYGRLSGCDPTIKLSYVMSKYYESQSRNQEACSFAGNGTVNRNAPTSASAADAAASSCISNPSAVFTPSSTGSGGNGGGSGGGSGSGSGSGQNGVERNAILGLGALAAVALTSTAWTLVL